MSFFSVYIGHYDNTNVTKKDIKKLNEKGLNGYLFSMGDFYSIKVASYPSLMVAESFRDKLILQGFDAFVQIPNS